MLRENEVLGFWAEKIFNPDDFTDTCIENASTLTAPAIHSPVTHHNPKDRTHQPRFNIISRLMTLFNKYTTTSS